MGQVTVVNFIFTHCVLFARDDRYAVQGRRPPEGHADAILSSLPIDPRHDTPETLKEVRGQLRRRHTCWRFAVAPEGQIETLLRDGLKFACAGP